MLSLMNKNRLKVLALAAFLPLCAQVEGAVILPGSIVNGTIDAGQPAANATDVDYLTAMRINSTGATTDRVSFVVDLQGEQNVHGVGIYGDPTYRASIGMLAGNVNVEAGDSASGPWTQIGSINVGNTRPTDPDPTIGGGNPFTGGNGRLIPCDGAAASFLRISGTQEFDNVIDVYHLQINPRLIIHQFKPVYTGTSLSPFDFGGGVGNSRAAPDLTDGLLNTRAFIGNQSDLVFDLGTARPLKEMRIHASESDDFALIRTGTMRVSSTDNPTNMDTVVNTFNTGGSKATAVVPMTGNPSKRFVQLTVGTNQQGTAATGTQATFRFSEVDYRAIEESPINTASVASFANGTSTTQAGVFDLDYNVRAEFGQTTGNLELTVALGTSTEVRSVGLYGDWAYRTTINAPSGVVTVEAGNSASGPWTAIGSRDFGSTRPTDPDPTIGGENVFTGGNGRRIPVTPTTASHLRIIGGYGYDSPILIYEAIVNPDHVLHTVNPVDQSQTLWDIGGGPLNTRAGAETVDGNLNTRINPRLLYTFTLDVAPTAAKIKEIRIFPMDNDIVQLPKTGVVRTSSTDSPTNFDTVENSFDVPITGGAVVIPVASQPTKRYVQIQFLSGQTVAVPRVGEIEVVTIPAVIPNASNVPNWQMFE